MDSCCMTASEGIFSSGLGEKVAAKLFYRVITKLLITFGMYAFLPQSLAVTAPNHWRPIHL